MLETLLLSAGIPILTDLFKSVGSALSRRFIGLSIDDEIKLRQADTAALAALAALDVPGGTPSQWVIDLRGSFRYIFSGILVVAGALLAAYGCYRDFADFIEAGLQLATAPLGFILGERMVLTFKGKQ